jgi:hypothetical protein
MHSREIALALVLSGFRQTVGGPAGIFLLGSDPLDAGVRGAVMPHFFFHIRGPDQSLSRDELGSEFPDVETAYLEMFHAAQDLGGEFAVCGQNPRDYAIEVMNASDELVFELPFSELLGRRR